MAPSRLSGRGVARINPSLWSVDQVVDKKIEDGQTFFRVKWNHSTLDRGDVLLRDDGTSYASVDGHEYDIEDCHPRSGGLITVHWQDSWHQQIDLTGTADELIEDFESGSLPPETAGDAVAADLPFASFTPASNMHDYTESFVTKLKALLQSGSGRWYKGKTPIWVAYLDYPTRNLLIFRKHFINKRNVINMSLASARHEHRRILSIHRTGNALLKPCNHCRNGDGSRTSNKRVRATDSNHAAKRSTSDADTGAESGPASKLIKLNTENHTFELPWWHGAWEDTFASNSIGGPAEWSSPVNASTKTNVGCPETLSASTPVKPYGLASPANRTDQEHQSSRNKSTSVPRQSAEQSRVKLLERFRGSASPARKKILSNVPRNQSVPDDSMQGVSASSQETRATESLEVSELLARCTEQRKKMLETAWTMWLDERKRECKAQPFTSAKHFFEIIWHRELTDSATAA
ncbi:hypothetical protein Slin15195_G114410 [Septoria linicola]|uniref:Uncharacterized protein n=1 Tax=Septoria linicola TaxID=215465 RepID=A0A9Q9B689_9PEZI|nr:hypothetical protein Slin15195_G114410 [Septoria linicola]